MAAKNRTRTGKAAITSAAALKKGVTGDQVTIRVENYLPENVPTFYSDAVTILHTANEFILSFLQTVFPLAASKEELEQITALRRKCVAQVIVSPAQAQALIKALQENVDKYLAEYRKLDGEE